MLTKSSLLALALTLSAATFAHAQATAPNSQTLQATITQVVGSAQARKSDNDKWETAKVGMILGEGSEIRTNIRSKVVYRIPPDQDIVIDRVSITKLLLATRSGNEVHTKLGMPYGRTQYLVEEAGVQHNAEITSPGATLAVRGTKDMLLYDQGPFTPMAYASQPVKLRTNGKTVAFGKAGARAKVSADKNSPGEQSLVETRVDPAGNFSGRTTQENALLAYLAKINPNFDISQYRLLALIADPNFKGTVAAVLPISGQLQFTMFWQDIINSDLDLAVISPKGERVDFTHQKVSSSGRYLGQGTDPKSGVGINGVADKSGFGQEAIVWETNYPPGTYTIETSLKSAKGSTVTAQIFVICNPLSAGQVVGSFSNDVTAKAPAINTLVVPPTATCTAPPATPRRK